MNLSFIGRVYGVYPKYENTDIIVPDTALKQRIRVRVCE